MSNNMRKLALVVGHTRSAPGACNKAAGVCEFAWNSTLALMMEQNPVWKRHEIQVVRLWRPENNSISGLVTMVNASHADVFVELHANAYDGRATGTETLHWHSSAAGKALAGAIQTATLPVLGLRDRGLKPISAGGRGATQLGKTRPVAILTEPFFIDNDADLAVAEKQKRLYAARLSEAIAAWMRPRPSKC